MRALIHAFKETKNQTGLHSTLKAFKFDKAPNI